MPNEVFVFDATTENFPAIVIENSNKIPVIVEFMGVWSEPCFIVEEIYSKLAVEFAGRFIFAKVDIDEQPALSEQYGIENVPAILVFHQGELARVEIGQMTEHEARVLLRDFGIFNENDALREQAREKHLAGDTSAAIMLLTQAIRSNPADTHVAMDMVQIFIDIGNIADATSLFNRLPDRAKESDTGKSLIGQLTFIDLASKTEGIEALEKRLAENVEDHDARFDLSVCLIAIHDYQLAMDQLLELIKAAPEYKDGAAREMMIGVTRTLSETQPELAQEYKRKLGNLMA